MKQISAEDLGLVLNSVPSLLIGPGQTVGSNGLDGCNDHVAEKFGEIPARDLWCTSEGLIESGVDRNDIEAAVREYFATHAPAPGVGALASVRWRAILSLAIDHLLEHKLSAWMSKNPLRGVPTVISDPSDFIPPRSTPVFKLVGSIHDSRMPITRNDLIIRQGLWHLFLARFADVSKAAPLLCVGFGGSTDLLLQLLGFMIADTRIAPAHVVMLADDPAVREDRLVELVSRGLRVMVADTTIGGFKAKYKAQLRHQGTMPLVFMDEPLTGVDRLRAFSEVAITVNACLDASVRREESRRLYNLLFSPTSLQWDPFVHALDFARSITTTIRATIDDGIQRSAQGRHVVAVTAPSATGKTTILKRVAYDLAKEQHLVLWCRPYFYQDGAAEMSKLCQAAKEAYDADGHPVVIFVDDPLGLGSIRLSDIRAALDRAQLPAVIVVGARTSELDTLDEYLAVGGQVRSSQIDVPVEFDDDEMRRLPLYLESLGIAESPQHANELIARATSRNATDILSMLFWLLPESRPSITDSVREEYLRLGDRQAFSEVLVGEINHTTALLKDAYALVACAEKHGSGVPMEVLVHALGVGYGEWVSTVPDEGLLWGLLYQEYAEGDETIHYRTRNTVVTDVIVRQVNGGVLSRTAEISHLVRLLSACSGSSPVYRDFCLRLLIDHGQAVLNELDFEDGQRLFVAAIQALPFDDATLLHHLGNWQRRKGKDYAAAKETLERALKAKPYPYSSRTESPEHIRTTLAANARDAIRNGQLSTDEGTQEALKHLERASSRKFMNAHATHEQASLIADLADLRVADPDADFFGLVEHALRDVDRMLLILRSTYNNDPQSRDSVLMLEQKRDSILDRLYSDDELESLADRLWSEHRRMDAFVVYARRLFRRAKSGREFKRAWEYCEELRSRASAEGVPPTRGLLATMLHIRLQWQVRRGVMTSLGEPIDWDVIQRLSEELLNIPGEADDPFNVYVLALASAHLNDWQRANAIFHDLRTAGLPNDVLWETRDFLMNDAGGMRRVQGRMSSGSGARRFIRVAELETDLPVDRRDDWPEDGVIAHALVHFRFAGPQASTEA